MYAPTVVLFSGILAALHSIGLFDSGLKEHVSRRRFACARLELCAVTLVQMVAQLLPQSQPRYAPADDIARCAFGSLISSPRTCSRLLFVCVSACSSARRSRARVPSFVTLSPTSASTTIVPCCSRSSPSSIKWCTSRRGRSRTRPPRPRPARARARLPQPLCRASPH